VQDGLAFLVADSGGAAGRPASSAVTGSRVRCTSSCRTGTVTSPRRTRQGRLRRRCAGAPRPLTRPAARRNRQRSEQGSTAKHAPKRSRGHPPRNHLRSRADAGKRTAAAQSAASDGARADQRRVTLSGAAGRGRSAPAQVRTLHLPPPAKTAR
jgi:hypothetical protein